MYLTMTIKTKYELQQLDEDLHLFEEEEWDFFSESFITSRDEDFMLVPKSEYIKYGVCVATLVGAILFSGVHLYNITIGRHLLSGNAVQAVSPYNTKTKLDRVDGSSVSSEDFIEVQRLLSGYFSIVQSGNSLKLLNSMCVDNSKYYLNEQSHMNSMKSSYDEDDCYLRATKCFARYISILRVNDVIYSDGTYYAYVQMGYPDKDSLREYYYSNSSILKKYVSARSISKESIVRGITSLIEAYDLPISDEEICIELKKDSISGYLIRDDTFVLDRCEEIYNNSIEYIVELLGKS